MTADSAAIVQRIWNYCNVLRDDGMSYGDYLEQLTYLLFLKMEDEQVRMLGKAGTIPDAYSWQSLLSLDGDALESHYRQLLVELGTGAGLVPVIFRKAQNRIQDPAKLRRLIELINGETWIGLDIDVKGAIYEGLLEKNAQDTKSGAGQYFTPRALIKGIVDVMNPAPEDAICDQACGTCGFLLVAYDHNLRHYSPLDRDRQRHVTHDALHGWEIVDNTARLGVMNLHLHGIGAGGLAADPGDRFSMVLTNPPFGKKSSVTYVNEQGETRREALTIVRDDFWTSTSIEQLNFVQHVKTILAINGRAAVVVPDNVLFEGGAGEVVRRKLLHECDVHTILRLPTGIFYAQGVKANVLFFDRKPAGETPWTKQVWFYDLRTNKSYTLKENPLQYGDLDEFVALYNPRNRHERAATWSETAPRERWRAFSYDEIVARDKVSLDIFWLRDESLDDSATLPHPSVLASEIVEDLRAALEQFAAIADDLAAGDTAMLNEIQDLAGTDDGEGDSGHAARNAVRAGR